MMEWDGTIRVIQGLATVLLGLYSVMASRRSASAAEAQTLAERLNSQDTRIVTIEQHILHLPDGKQMADLAGDMKAIKAELAGVARELAPLSRSLDRINDYLLSSRTA